MYQFLIIKYYQFIDRFKLLISGFRLYPYSKIKTENLFLLLLSARILALVSLVVFFISLYVTLFGLTYIADFDNVFSDIHIDEAFGMSGILNSILLLAVSGVCAAVVSFEYKYSSSN